MTDFNVSIDREKNQMGGEALRQRALGKLTKANGIAQLEGVNTFCFRAGAVLRDVCTLGCKRNHMVLGSETIWS
jgi:hypothetical protein